MRDRQPGEPARGTTAVRRSDVVEHDPRSRQRPRHHRVRVPHVTGSQLVSTPRRGRNHRDEIEHASSNRRIVGDSDGSADRMSGIRNRTACPTPHLVPEDAPSTELSEPDRTFSHDPTLTPGDPDRCHLDRGRGTVDSHLERRVEQRLTLTTFDNGGDRLVAATAHANESTTSSRTQWNPVEVDAVGHRHHACRWAVSGRGREFLSFACGFG